MDNDLLQTGIDTRRLMRAAAKAALATRHYKTGAPYVSLVTVSTTFDARPVLLLSKLALHTMNLTVDPSASILFDGTDKSGDPLAGGRVTVMGTVRPASQHELPIVSQRFLNRHPAARGYAGFADFGFYVLEPIGAHFIGGFGRIVDLPCERFLLAENEAALWQAGAERLIEALSADDLHLVASALSGMSGGASGGAGVRPESVRVADLDCDGLTVEIDGANRHLMFEAPLLQPSMVHDALRRLAQQSA